MHFCATTSPSADRDESYLAALNPVRDLAFAAGFLFVGLELPLKEDVDFPAQLAERNGLHEHPRRARLLQLGTQRGLPFGKDGDVDEAVGVDEADLLVDVDDLLADRVAD